MTGRRSQMMATGMILAATLLWSLMAPLSRALFGSGVDPLGAVAVRAVCGGMILCFTLRLARGRWETVARGDIRLTVTYGLLIAGNYLAYFQAFATGTVTMAAFALHTYPAMVAIGARLSFGEPITKRRLVSLACAGVGVVLLTGTGGSGGFAVNGPAVAWGLLSAACLAGHVLAARTLVRKYDSYVVVQHGLCIAGVVLGGAWLAAGARFPLTWSVAGLLGVLVLGSTVGAYCLFTAAIRSVPVGRAGVITLAELVWVMAWGTILGESVRSDQALGAALILAGVITAVTERTAGSNVTVSDCAEGG